MNQDGGKFPVRRSGTTRSRRSLVHGIIGLAAALAACDGPVPDQGESERPVRLPEVVDSAGIRIVTNFEPQWNEGEEWVVEAEPYIVLGEGSDELSPYLGQVNGAAAPGRAGGPRGLLRGVIGP